MKRHLLFTWLKGIFLALVVFFVGRRLVLDLSSLDLNGLKLNPWYLLAALGLEFLSRGCLGASYYVLLKGRSDELPLAKCMQICWFSQLGKYIPGKLGLIIGAAYFLDREKVERSMAIGMPLFITLGGVMTGICLGLPEIKAWEWAAGLGFTPNPWWGLGLVLILPLVTHGMGTVAATWFPKKFHWPRFRLTSLFQAHLLLLGQYLSFGVAGYLVLISLFPAGLVTIGEMISFSSLAVASGVLVVLSPAGIGVREGVLLVLLNGEMVAGDAALLIVLIRLVQTLADVGVGCVGGYFLKKSKN